MSVCWQGWLAKPGKSRSVWDGDRRPDLHPYWHLILHDTQCTVCQGQTLHSHAGRVTHHMASNLTSVMLYAMLSICICMCAPTMVDPKLCLGRVSKNPRGGGSKIGKNETFCQKTLSFWRNFWSSVCGVQKPPKKSWISATVLVVLCTRLATVVIHNMDETSPRGITKTPCSNLFCVSSAMKVKCKDTKIKCHHCTSLIFQPIWITSTSYRCSVIKCLDWV